MTKLEDSSFQSEGEITPTRADLERENSLSYVCRNSKKVLKTSLNLKGYHRTLGLYSWSQVSEAEARVQ